MKAKVSIIRLGTGMKFRIENLGKENIFCNEIRINPNTRSVFDKTMDGFGYYCYNKTELTEDAFCSCVRNMQLKGTNACNVLIKLTEVF